MCAICLFPGIAIAEQMVDNMKLLFLNSKSMKYMFLYGAPAPFWGVRHQNQPSTLP
jgi:hypothetical protein